MAHNDKLIKQGLMEIQDYLDSLSTETAKKFTLFEAKFMIEKHVTLADNALTLLQSNVDLLLYSVLHAQAGKVQPQLVPPRLLLTLLWESGILPTGHYPTFRTDHTLYRLGIPGV
jgi:hypothetical protein